MSTKTQRPEALREIPRHLKPFTTEQKYELYTPIDHSVWRFIMKMAEEFFSRTAHFKYLEGLRETGISVEKVPSVQEMDEKLKKIGWRAAAVSGFIPPAIFLEFLAQGIMPIACELRKLENIAYTPAPDIVHEAAGHAPIVADDEYNDYLRAYGEVAIKAIFCKKDLDLYHAILGLSEVKEKPNSTKEEIAAAQKHFEESYAALDYVSEATHLARMSWWTIEYGMVGSLDDYKIYGAGLLSSLGESYHCLSSKVKKIPFSMDCIHQAYDITRPQPQLFVAPSFQQMKKVLADYAKTMAYQLGGMQGLAKAKLADCTTTLALDSGLQVSGTVKDFVIDEHENLSYLELEGPLQLSEQDEELSDWKTEDLPTSIFTALGEIQKIFSNETEIDSTQLVENTSFKIHYQKQFIASGKILKIHKGQNGKISFALCENLKIRKNGKDYGPSQERSLLFFAQKVPSVFGGAADRARYLEATNGDKYESKPHITNRTEDKLDLEQFHQQLRDFRDEKNEDFESLSAIVQKVNEKYPKEWLIRWELSEIASTAQINPTWAKDNLERLIQLKTASDSQKELIERGLNYLIKKNAKTESSELKALA